MLVEKWNAQRAKAVAHALLKVLYPLMVKELRIKLLDEAKEHVLQVRPLSLHGLARYLKAKAKCPFSVEFITATLSC